MHTNLPQNVLDLQKLFASVITQPLDENEKMQKKSLLAEEYILPSAKLSSSQRIEIYNQQYWRRLLTALQENFPGLTRLFGYCDFNASIGTPFLEKHPSDHWSLGQLGWQLPEWIEAEYQGADKLLVAAMARVDWAYQEIFSAPFSKKIEVSLDLLTKKMHLQHHVRIFTFHFHIFSFRSELLQKDVGFWTESDFPLLQKNGPYFFLLYRTQENLVSFKEIKKGEWFVLRGLEEGKCLEEICGTLESLGGSLYAEARKSLHTWIAEWMRNKWLEESNV